MEPLNGEPAEPMPACGEKLELALVSWL